MFTNHFFRKIFHNRLVDIDQVKLVYFLSLIVGLFSALAAAMDITLDLYPNQGFILHTVS